MQQYQLVSEVTLYGYEELPSEDRRLIDMAREATKRSYAPYSHFYVGAALRLKNGVELMGCNQENAASPVTVCAERSAIFAAGAQYPEQPVLALAISARNAEGFLNHPTAPCGSCRQVILETETRFGQPVRVLLDSRKGIHVVESIKALLPLQFTGESMGNGCEGNGMCK